MDTPCPMAQTPAVLCKILFTPKQASVAMTTELIHGGISLSDLLHRPSDSESTDRRGTTDRQVPLLGPHQSNAEVGTQAEMTTLSPIHDGQMEGKRIPIFVVPTGCQQKKASSINIC